MSNPKPNRPLVIIESPFAGEVERNKIYCKRCILDSLKRGEAPFASHALYTQVLDDTIPDDRTLGMQAGFAVIYYSEFTAVYVDYGMSKGMTEGIEIAESLGHPVLFRKIGLNDNSRM